MVSTVNTFIADIVKEWQDASPAANLQFANRFGEDAQIVTDSALKQIVFNLLDNAVEASPNWIQLTASREEDTLVLEVRDLGKGFAPKSSSISARPINRPRAAAAASDCSSWSMWFASSAAR